MKEKIWILESAIILALTTGALYAFGHYYNYRMRFEFDIQTISLGISSETFIHDGATVLIAWFGTTKEFWIALLLVSIATAIFLLLSKKYNKPKFSNAVLLSLILGIVISYFSVTQYIPSRAKENAQAIKRLALVNRHALDLRDGSTAAGYTIIGSPSKIAFLTNEIKVMVISNADVKLLRIDSE